MWHQRNSPGFPISYRVAKIDCTETCIICMLTICSYLYTTKLTALNFTCKYTVNIYRRNAIYALRWFTDILLIPYAVYSIRITCVEINFLRGFIYMSYISRFVFRWMQFNQFNIRKKFFVIALHFHFFKILSSCYQLRSKMNF